MGMVVFVKTIEYSDWYESQTDKIKAQIDARLLKIQDLNHYGHVKRLSSVLYEIKFNNGNRIYYMEKIVDGKMIILILGGNKNGQAKDIKRAQKIAEKIHGD
jgi:putative addiction module killer protein